MTGANGERGARLRIGVDVGGTKIEAIALDAGGEVRARRRVPSPAQDYAQVVTAVRDLVLAVEAEIGARASVGVGTPGALSPATGLIKNANSTRLNGRAFDVDLGHALEREVRMANDANCFALSEASDGAGAGRRIVFGAILGTGVGGGIVYDGRVWVGANAIAGEWGHNEHADARRSGARRHALLLRPTPLHRDVPLRPRPRRPTTRAPTRRRRPLRRGVDRRARRARRPGGAGDAGALRRPPRERARGRIDILDPDIIVLGGGLSNVDALYPRGQRAPAGAGLLRSPETRVARTCTAIPPACAAPRGSGRPERSSRPRRLQAPAPPGRRRTGVASARRSAVDQVLVELRR